jgi:hypothetical protein
MRRKYRESFLHVRAQIGFRQVGRPSSGVIHAVTSDDKTLCGITLRDSDWFDGECFQSDTPPTCRRCAGMILEK